MFLEPTKDDDGWNYVRNNIIDRVSELTVTCPECENILLDDDQYQCTTCGGQCKINVLNWVKDEFKHNQNKNG